MGSGLRQLADYSTDPNATQASHGSVPWVYFFIYQDDTGAGLTGEAANLDMAVRGVDRESGTITTVAYNTGDGWTEIDATNAPGVYAFDPGFNLRALPGDYLIYQPDLTSVSEATKRAMPRSLMIARDFPYEYGLAGLTFSSATDSLTVIDDVITQAASAITRDD